MLTSSGEIPQIIPSAVRGLFICYTVRLMYQNKDISSRRKMDHVVMTARRRGRGNFAITKVHTPGTHVAPSAR